MAEKRDDRLKEISEKLEQGVKELFTSERYAEYLATMSKFHNYSFNNTMLIALQKPDATLVAGYQAWQKKFKRQVKRGEKGIQIIAPVPVRHKEEVEKIDPETHEPVLKDNGQPETEEVVTVIPRFRVTTVFDVDQTYGEPLPELGNGDLTAGVENYGIFMEALRRVSPVPMRFAKMDGTSHGYYHNVDKEIVIKDGMSESQTMKTAVHEISHAKLHDREIMEEQGIEKDKETKEVEAESIAYMVCQSFGLDTSDYSFPYIAGWSGSREMKELRTSMDTIRKTAGELIDSIGEELKELQKERQTEIGRDDIVLKITFDENDQTYHRVWNMGKAELLEQLGIYHGINPEDQIGVGDFLIDLGAELTPLPSPGDENISNPVTFYDVEYDYRSGANDVADLPAPAFAEMQIARAEYGATVFSDEERDLIANYAYKLDDKNSARKLVWDLKDALESPEGQTAEIKAAAQAEIDALPDGMVGLSEMHGYGYRDDSMLPLTAERAEELYGEGLGIFCLYPDGTEAAVEDAAIFQSFEGMFAIEKEIWENHLEGQKAHQMEGQEKPPEMQEERYQEVEVFGIPMLYHEGRMLDDNVPEGLKKYDLRGMDLDPGLPATIEEVVVVNHAASVLSAYEIDLKKDGALMLGGGFAFTGKFMTAAEYRDRISAMDKGMLAETAENEIGLANENLLWNGSEDRYAIYQINERSLSRENLFMNLDYLQSHGQDVYAQDYNLIYSGKLAEGVTLDSIYARFNYDHPADYTGHSLSVSDVVVLQRDGKTTAHFVDSVDFQELPDFVQQRQTVYQANRMVSNTHSINENSTGIEVEQHEGTWRPVDSREINGQEFFLMEHEKFGDAAASVIVDANGELAAQELENGFDAGAYQAIREYFTERGIPVYDRRLIAETEAADKGGVNQEESLADTGEEHAATGNQDIIEPGWAEEAQAEQVLPVENTTGQSVLAEPETDDAIVGRDSQRQKTYPPVYPYLLSYARDRGEVDAYLDSKKLNIDCKNAIETAIRENFDGWHLKHDAAAPILEEYGAERVSVILANTMNHQDYDGRYSRTNREWAKGVPVFEGRANGYDMTLDYLLTSHPAVLDGFIDLVRQEINEREKEKEMAAEKSFIGRYYVIENLQEKGSLNVRYYASLDEALSAYDSISNQNLKALGVENTERLTGSLDFIQCRMGIDGIVQDYKKAEGWDRPEITNLVNELEKCLDAHDAAIAYEIPDGYLAIHSADEGYDYTFYDKECREIDGGIYDNPYTPVKEVIESLLDEQGLILENCTVADYSGITEKAEEMEQERLLKVAQELFPDKEDVPEKSEVHMAAVHEIPLISEHSEPETALNGLSRAEIEETALCMAQAAIDDMGLSGDVKLIGARVYGSRTRDGLYHEGSDIDVVLSYTGGIAEDYFFNVLHEDGMKMAGIPLDINPIDMEKTGTLEDYLAKAEQYLDEREAALASGEQQREAAPAPKEVLTFFAAEDSEFHVFGRYEEGLTLREAVDLYNQFLPDVCRGIPGIGFHYHNSGSIYDGSEHDIYSGGEVLWEDTNAIEAYRSSEPVREAMKELQEMAERGEIRGYKGTEQKKETARDKTQEPSVGKTEDEGKNEGHGQPVASKTEGNGKKESVLQALRQRQAKIREQEKAGGKEPSQSRKKGDMAL